MFCQFRTTRVRLLKAALRARFLTGSHSKFTLSLSPRFWCFNGAKEMGIWFERKENLDSQTGRVVSLSGGGSRVGTPSKLQHGSLGSWSGQLDGCMQWKVHTPPTLQLSVCTSLPVFLPHTRHTQCRPCTWLLINYTDKDLWSSSSAGQLCF